MSKVNIKITCDDKLKLLAEGDNPSLISLGIFSQKVCKLLEICDDEISNNISDILMAIACEFNDIFDKLTTGGKNERSLH